MLFGEGRQERGYVGGRLLQYGRQISCNVAIRQAILLMRRAPYPRCSTGLFRLYGSCRSGSLHASFRQGSLCRSLQPLLAR